MLASSCVGKKESESLHKKGWQLSYHPFWCQFTLMFDSAYEMELQSDQGLLRSNLPFMSDLVLALNELKKTCYI